MRKRQKRESICVEEQTKMDVRERGSYTGNSSHFSPSPGHGFYLWLCHNSASGDSAFQGLLLSLAAFISAMNSQLFVFVQLNPGLFMTVYHGGNLAKSPPHYWVSQINDIQCQSWVKQ